MRKGGKGTLSSVFLVGAVNVGFYVINLKFIPVLAAPSSVASSVSVVVVSARRNRQTEWNRARARARSETDLT